MIETVTGALTALRGTIGLVKAAVEARDYSNLKDALAPINDRIIAVQDACMRLQETNAALLQDKHALANEKRELENEIAQLRQQADKLERYERMKTPVGAVVFIDAATADSDDGPVYACASCMDDGKVSTLQPIHGGNQLRCPAHGDLGFTTEPMNGPVGMMLPSRLRT